jgi:hypothetical protein
MDEMTLLRSLRAVIPAADVTREAEEAFISCMTAEAANPPPSTARPITARLRRLRPVLPGGRGWPPPAVRDFAWRLSAMGGGRRWRLAVAGGVSVTLAVGVTAGVEYGAKSPGPASKPAPAVVLADKAAAAAAAQPPVLPGQWVYTKTVNDTITPAGSRQACAVKNGRGQVHDVFFPALPGLLSIPPGTPCAVRSNGMMNWGNCRAEGGGRVLPPWAKHVTVTGSGTVVAINYPAATLRQEKEQWSTADGTRNASYLADGRLVITAACPCGMVSYANLGKLPSEPKALVRWAMRPPGGGGHYTTADLAWNAFNGIEGTLMSYVLPPKVTAELYRALRDIPGVTVDKDAVDAAGLAWSGIHAHRQGLSGWRMDRRGLPRPAHLPADGLCRALPR